MEVREFGYLKCPTPLIINVGLNCKRMSEPDKLYHFTKTETALRWILPNEMISKNSRLKLNKINKMNDPKENLLFVTDLDECIQDPIESYSMSGESYVIANYIREESNILCFSTDREINGNKKKRYQLQRMWSQYGLNCSGVCLELDFKKFIKSNENLINEAQMKHGYVQYNHHNFFNIPSPLHGVSDETAKTYEPKTLKEFWKDLQHKEKFIRERFFSKNSDWEGEAEYRFLSFENQENFQFMNITDSIERIILGLNFSKHYLPAIEKLVPKEKIFLLKMNQDEEFIIRPLKTTKINKLA